LAARGVDFVNIGIGINVAQTPGDLPPEAIGLCAASGNETLQPADLLPELFEALSGRIDWWEAAGGRPSLDPWRTRAIFLGQPVAIVQVAEQLTGVFAGVDDDGRLLLTTTNGDTVRVSHGDLVRGPRPIGG
jgi:BirA family biotin operon repressor/biotin-[acetyl-CoA-carboxylase] ligase